MQLNLSTQPSIIQELSNDWNSQNSIRLFIKRDDLLHPNISGNKWRKLKHNLLVAQAQNKSTLLTFGGAFSNHIAAVAAAGQLFQFQTIGIIRGELVKPLNPTLDFAQKCGMILHSVTRSQYRDKQNPTFIAQLNQTFGDFYLIPEGGSNALALQGCAEIIEEIKGQSPVFPNIICVPSGTAGTMSGLIVGLKGKQRVLGFSILKGDFLEKEIKNLLRQAKQEIFENWDIITDYHFGGYAKFRPELIQFINTFFEKYQIPLDPIYTGKMMFGIFDLIQKGYFKKGTNILAIHTGGLQGIKGFNQRFGNLIKQ